MSMRPEPIGDVPADTAAVARQAFPRGNPYLRLRDELGPLYQDAQFAALYPTRGQPAWSPWRLAVVLVLQFAEGLSDRQAADAVRSRIDWKYLLGLPLTDAGFDPSVLAEFRTRLVSGGVEESLLRALLELVHVLGLLGAGGRQRTDATHVLASVRRLSRLECVLETLRQALEHLAVAAPDWLAGQLDAGWIERYAARSSATRFPRGEGARQALAIQIGTDGFRLLAALWAPEIEQPWLRQLPAVATLRQVWLQQYQRTSAQTVGWRSEDDLPPASQLIVSPYDVQARTGVKRGVTWVGSKVQLTETCEPTAPHLITQVTTTPAPVADVTQLAGIQADLAAKGLLPHQHLVDASYVDGGLVDSAARGVDLLGPAPADTSWQAQAGAGFATSDFTIDWAARQARCPRGHTSTHWSETTDSRGKAAVVIRFAGAACRACADRIQCTHAARAPRELQLRPEAEHQALVAARDRQATPAFAAAYAVRAGIEGPISQAVRGCGLRRARYIGLAKTHLEHVLIAVAVNLQRLTAWWTGIPRAPTRRAHFVTLLAAA